MFRIKAIAAIALTGLGGAAVGTDAYMVSHPPSAPLVAHVLRKNEALGQKPAVVMLPSPTATNTVVTITPVTITSPVPARRRVTAQIAETPSLQFVPCSQWRALDTGPAGRGVRALCVASASSAPR